MLVVDPALGGGFSQPSFSLNVTDCIFSQRTEDCLNSKVSSRTESSGFKTLLEAGLGGGVCVTDY